MDIRKAEDACDEMRECVKNLANDAVDSVEPMPVTFWEGLRMVMASVRELETELGIKR